MASSDLSINESHSKIITINKDVIKKEYICKFCRDDLNEIRSQEGNEVLKNICECKGSIGYVCKLCLAKWLDKNGNFKTQKNIICADCSTEINCEKIFSNICKKCFNRIGWSTEKNSDTLCDSCYIKCKGILQYALKTDIKLKILTLLKYLIIFLINIILFKIMLKFLPLYSDPGNCSRYEKYINNICLLIVGTFKMLFNVYVFTSPRFVINGS